MRKLIILLAILILSSQVCAANFINPITNVNYSCLFPINIATISLFSSDNRGADSVDRSRSSEAGVFCLCGIRPGIPMGMNTPSFILESTNTPFSIPSMGINLSSVNQYYMKGGTDTPYAATEGSKKAFMHTHIHQFSLLELIDIFTDAICFKPPAGSPFDIAYLSEIDPVANSSSLSILLYPETVLIANPAVAMSCSVDGLLTIVGRTLDLMFWCVGGNLTYPVSNHTIEASSYEAASATTVVKTMRRQQRYSIGRTFPKTSGNIAVQSCGFPIPSLDIIKSQHRLQVAYPFAGRCSRMGEPSTMWNKPKRSLTNADMVYILWNRVDCCAL